MRQCEYLCLCSWRSYSFSYHLCLRIFDFSLLFFQYYFRSSGLYSVSVLGFFYALFLYVVVAAFDPSWAGFLLVDDS